MDYNARILAKGDPDRLADCFAAEEKSFERSTYTLKKTKDGLEFEVTARDAVALRATLNSISQLLIVFEGARKLKNG